MARFRVIILEKLSKGSVQVSFAMWADVPAAQQTFYANAAAVSTWKGATAGDISALTTGAVVERIETLSMDAGATNAQLRNSIEARWTAFQNEITSADKWARYGSTWDGANWVAAGA